jgi:predicted nucleic acid-binding protein
LKNESSKPKIVLDTKPLIKLFAQEEGWDAVQKILSRVEAGDLEAAISVVTLTEIYYKYMKEKRADLAEDRTNQFRYAVYLKKLLIDEEVAVKAGDFKGKYNISIADAFIAATADLEEAVIISDDPDFEKIQEIKTLTEKQFVTRLLKE